jgi:hypothetical protein
MKAGRLATIALAVLALLALTLGAYVGGYLWLGEVLTYVESRLDTGGFVDVTIVRRNYPHNWQRDIFQPAATVERWLRGIEVRAVCNPPMLPDLNDEAEATGARILRSVTTQSEWGVTPAAWFWRDSTLPLKSRRQCSG